jgi:flagellar hook-length control protein FliK
MQTTPVLNPLLTTKSPQAQANRPAEQNAPAQPFKQVLSREMADRGKVAAKEPAKATDTAKAAQMPAPQKAAGKDKAGKSDETREARDSAEGEEVEKNGIADAGATAAADMLALVANIAPVVAPAVESGKADTPPEAGADTSAAVTAGAGLLTEIGSDKTARPEAIMAAAGAAGKAADDKPAKAFAVTDTRPAPVEANIRSGTDAQQALNMKPEAGNTESAQPDTTPKAEASPSPVKPAEDFAAKGQALMRGQQDAAEAPASIVEPAQSAMQPVSTQPSPHAALQALNNAAVRADHLAPRVGSNAWDQALGQKITWMVAGEQQTASLTLNPPDLGPLQVVLSVTNSQANATFTAAQPEVRQALEAAMPKLREMLGDAGIQLGQASVNSGNPQQQGQFERQAGATPAQRMTGSEPAAEPVARTTRIAPAGSGRGMVDTFA